MNILILNWRDIKHPQAGGAEISTHEHAKRWVKEGHSVIQFSSAAPGEKEKEIIDAIQVIRRGNMYTVHLRAFFYYLFNLRNSIDLVVDEFHAIPFFTPLYVQAKKIAFIHETAEEIWFKNSSFPINILGFLFEPLFFKLYRNIPFMTVSESTKKDLKKFGIQEKQIYVIHNGIHTRHTSSKKEKKPTILYLGRLAKDKGTKDAFNAFFLIQKKIIDAKLWVVGKEETPGYKRELEELAKKLGIEKKVTFFNYVTDEDKYNLLKKSWILIHPSIKEGWGLTVIEAAAQGTPTVAYDTAGLRDSIINKKTGLLVSRKTPEELAKKIIMVVEDKIMYNNLNKNALKWSKKFTWKDAADKSLELIRQII